MSATASEGVETEQNTEPQSVLLTEGSFIADESTPAPESDDAVPDPPVKHDELQTEVTAEVNERTEDAIQETLSEKLDKISIHEEEEEADYVNPVPDPYARAIRYMEHHNVMQIFQASLQLKFLTSAGKLKSIFNFPDFWKLYFLVSMQSLHKPEENSI